MALLSETGGKNDKVGDQKGLQKKDRRALCPPAQGSLAAIPKYPG